MAYYQNKSDSGAVLLAFYLKQTDPSVAQVRIPVADVAHVHFADNREEALHILGTLGATFSDGIATIELARRPVDLVEEGLHEVRGWWTEAGR